MISILQIECEPQSGQYRYRIVEAGGDGEVLVPWRWGSFDVESTIARARSLFSFSRWEELYPMNEKDGFTGSLRIGDRLFPECAELGFGLTVTAENIEALTALFTAEKSRLESQGFIL